MPKPNAPTALNLYIWDIETISVPDALLEELMPVEFRDDTARELPPELRNATPPTEINKTLEKSLAKARDKGDAVLIKAAEDSYAEWREKKAEEWRENRRQKIDKWNGELLEKKLKWVETANLRAETTNVPLICVHQPDGTIIVFFIGKETDLELPKLSALNPVKVEACASERALLSVFWRYVYSVLRKDTAARFAGWNSSRAGGFDLSMIKRRSWILKVAFEVATHGDRGYADLGVWLDLMEVWQCGDRQLYASADSVARALGCKARKTGTGGEFPKYWREDKTKAVAYCMGDVLCEREIAESLGYPTTGEPV